MLTKNLLPIPAFKSTSKRHITATVLVLSFSLASPGAFSEVSVSGLDGDLKDNAMLRLSLAKQPCEAPKWKIKHFFSEADAEIDQALRALGHYHVVTKKKLAFNKNCWLAEFDINPGPRVIVDDVDINISGDALKTPEFAESLKNMPLKKGSPLHHGQYESMKSKISSVALDLGFLNSRFTEKKLVIDKVKNTADIKIHFDSGKRLHFGEIKLQQDILNNDFVFKYLTIKNGDPYTSEQLAKTHNALSQSGYFETVDIRTDLEHVTDQRIPINISLTPKKTAHYGFGIGYDTDVGPLLNASYINRRINRYGHFFTSNLDLSPVLSTAEIEYTIPLDKPTTDLFSFGGGLKREHTDTFKSMSATLSARHKHVYASSWRQTLFLDYNYEDFTTDSDTGQTLLLVPGGNWLRSVSDNPVRPNKGHRIELEAKGSFENPISDVSFLQGNLSATWLHTFSTGGKIIGRTLQGVTLVNRITDLPTSYRFYAGGINSVRGYAYKELGPKDKLGNVEGGELLSVFSAEYEHPILDNWGVAAFLDTGNAFNFDKINLNTGVGLGVRWYSPVGPIRVDFALPLDESDSSFQIHFAAGSRL